MANRTIKEANSIRGTNPQYLIEKIIRNRIYDCRYWKEDCFGLTAELLVDKAMALDHIGSTFAQNVQATPFICLVLKMLQIQPSKDIIVEFIRRSDYKYVRALGAYYLRLVGTSVDIYKYLEPLFIDYRKMKYINLEGNFVLTHMDEYINDLLTDERVFNIVLPRLQKRCVLEESELLPPRLSALEDDITGIASTSQSEDDSDTRNKDLEDHNSPEANENISRESLYTRTLSPFKCYKERSARLKQKHLPHLGHFESRVRSRSMSRSLTPPHNKGHQQIRISKSNRNIGKDRVMHRRRLRDEKITEEKVRDKPRDSSNTDSKKKYTKEQLEEIREQNQLRASLGLKPLNI